MVGVDRVAVVRSAYEAFNHGDVEGVLALVTDDVEWPDVIHDSVLHGKDALRRYLNAVVTTVSPHMTLGEVVEFADVVLAMVHQQAYDEGGRRLGKARLVVNRFTFQADRIVRMEVTSEEDVPEEVRQRFHNG